MFRKPFYKNKTKNKIKPKIRPFVTKEHTTLKKKYGDPKTHREKEYCLFLDKFKRFGDALVFTPKKKPTGVPEFMQKFGQKIPPGIITIFAEKLANISRNKISSNKEKKQLLNQLSHEIVKFEKEHHLSEMQELLKERIKEIQQKIFGITTDVSIFTSQKRYSASEKAMFASFENEWEVLKKNYSAILRNYVEKQEKLASFKELVKKKRDAL